MIDDALRARAAELAKTHRVHVLKVDEATAAAEFGLSGPHSTTWLDRLDRVAESLADSTRRHRLDVIEFPAEGGLAYRALQKKRLGSAFANTQFILRSDQHPATSTNACGFATSTVAPVYAQTAAMDAASKPQAEFVATDIETLSRHYAETFVHEYLNDPIRESIRTPLVTVAVAYFNLPEFLDETLASLKNQTYQNLEVLVLDDGSSDPEARRVFEACRVAYPDFRFLSHDNRGIGATRNRGLEIARGDYFLPMDADNIARPDMIARLVQGLEQQPRVGALTSYFLAFRTSHDLARRDFAYAYKPLGGPRILGALQNIYGDANALFRVDALRALGGFTTDRDSSFEDWELFVRLANAGHAVEVLPEFLFYYRHRDAGFSRTTRTLRNHQRVLRQFIAEEGWSVEERAMLWNLLLNQHHRIERIENDNRALRTQLGALRYQIMDRLHALWRRGRRWMCV